MFKAFGFVLLIFGIVYVFLEWNNRRALKKNAASKRVLGLHSVDAVFVMKTVDALNSMNPDDLLIFELPDGTQLTFRVANAPTYAPGCRGVLTYNALESKDEWLSFTPGVQCTQPTPEKPLS